MSRTTGWALACLLALSSMSRADNRDIVAAARKQVGVTLLYDGGYQALAYPGGDVPAERGVCTDVVIRALRASRSLDLQRLIHEDITAHRADYAGRWRGTAPDSNIDHRRVPNQMTFFTRQGWAQPLAMLPAAYLPGDIVAWDLGRGVLHVGIVSDRKAPAGTPLIVHNIGAGAREDDILFSFRIIGHYRPPGVVAGSR
jgi:uncharacterized protein YijF (DUF1287 family)